MTDRPHISTKVTHSAVLLLLIVFSCGQANCAYMSDKIYSSTLPSKKYICLGDINIGVIAPISSKGKQSWCTDVNDTPLFEKYPDLMAYAVELYNKQYPLPYNMTMGFAFLDDCMDTCVASSQTTAFILHGDCPEGENDLDGYTTYDVVAVIGSLSTPQSLSMAHLLGPARIPQLSYASTLDKYDPRVMHPYFLTVVPPDWEQQQVIFELVQMYNWTYVSVLYTANVYFENGFSNLKDLFDISGICIAADYAVPQSLTSEEAETVARFLKRRLGMSRVVVLMMEPEAVSSIINATRDLIPPGTIIWIGTDAWVHKAHTMTDLGPFLWDSLIIDFQDAPVPNFDDWFRQLTPNKTTNPWFHDLWERYFNCTLNTTRSPNRVPCRKGLTLEDVLLPVDFSTTYTGYFVDAAFMIANATDRVLKSPECKGLMTKAEARACVTTSRLLKELMATHQYGFAGLAELDYNGVRHGHYTVSQLKPGPGNTLEKIRIADYDFTESSEHYYTSYNPITWEHINISKGFKEPESICSLPCKKLQIRTFYQFPCCWTCDSCLPTERIVRNATGCKKCPNFTLPDQLTGERCVEKPIRMSDFRTVTGVMKTMLALLSLCATIYVFSFFRRHQERRVIKASSVEISYIMLFAITLGYMIPILYSCVPSQLVCRTAFLLLGISFTLIYGPLLVRAVWVYRLFKASEKSTRRPRMTSRIHQLIFCLIIVGVQIVMMVVSLLYFDVWVIMTELTRLTPFVEFTCLIPTSSAQIVLSYNVILAAACGVLAYKTRHLPDNFNESHYITICIASSLIISISFIPTYLVTQQMLVKLLIINLTVFINHSVALGFLFMPKIYAILFVEEKRTNLVPNRLIVHAGRTRSLGNESTEMGSTFTSSSKAKEAHKGSVLQKKETDRKQQTDSTVTTGLTSTSTGNYPTNKRDDHGTDRNFDLSTKKNV